MFARRDRLPNARTVKRLYARGRRSSRPTVLVYVLPNQAKQSRFAVVCGKKVHAHATVRNRLKRVARALIHERQPQLAPGTDHLVVLRPAAAGHEAELQSDLAALLAERTRPSAL